MTTPKYSEDDLSRAVAGSASVSGVMRVLGIRPAGGSHQHISRRIKSLGIDTSHFSGMGWAKGERSPRRKTAAEIFVRTPPGSPRTTLAQLKRALTEAGVPEVCACGVGTEWQGLPLTLQVDHVDGDWNNNLRENLRYLCPNCHTQQETGRSHRLGREGNN